MHTKFIIALGSAVWLLIANPAFAEGVNSGDQEAPEGTQVDASAGKAGEAQTDAENVEYRRKSHTAERTGRSDRSSSGANAGGSSNSGNGGGESGGGGGEVD